MRRGKVMELRFHSPGLRAKHATLGMAPTNLATLTELRLAVGVTCSVYAHIPCISYRKKLQKVLWLFRALPYASVCVGRYLESRLSDILRHPHPRLPGGRLKSRKYKKSAVGGKKSPANAGTKRDYLIFYRQVSNRWNNTISCFFIANGGLFLRPPAAFWPMPAVVVMRSMALGVGATTKRETRFPTGVTDSHKKAKPTTAAMAFCVYINLLHK